jgi:hypothetical protein
LPVHAGPGNFRAFGGIGRDDSMEKLSEELLKTLLYPCEHL